MGTGSDLKGDPSLILARERDRIQASAEARSGVGNGPLRFHRRIIDDPFHAVASATGAKS